MANYWRGQFKLEFTCISVFAVDQMSCTNKGGSKVFLNQYWLIMLALSHYKCFLQSLGWDQTFEKFYQIMLTYIIFYQTNLQIPKNVSNIRFPGSRGGSLPSDSPVESPDPSSDGRSLFPGQGADGLTQLGLGDFQTGLEWRREGSQTRGLQPFCLQFSFCRQTN